MTTSSQVGNKVLGCVCAGSALLLAEDESTSVVNGTLVGVLLSQSASLSVVIVCFSPDRQNLGFLTVGKLAAIFIKPSIGVPNWPVIYFINSVALGGEGITEQNTSAGGDSQPRSIGRPVHPCWKARRQEENNSEKRTSLPFHKSEVFTKSIEFPD
jgi:hypothetical protein